MLLLSLDSSLYASLDQVEVFRRLTGSHFIACLIEVAAQVLLGSKLALSFWGSQEALAGVSAIQQHMPEGGGSLNAIAEQQGAGQICVGPMK